MLLFFLFLGGALLWAQDVPAGVIAAFKKGNAQELGKFLGERVELILQNKTQSVDRRAGEQAIASFFSANRVSDFQVNHQGKRGDSSFVVGTLQTSGGNYRVNCFFKKEENKYIVHQIRIDKNNE